MNRARPVTVYGIAIFLAVLVILAVIHVEPVHAQCALCVTALEQSPEGRGMARSFNRAILFLLAAPYAIFATAGIVIYRAHRRKKLEDQRANPYLPKH
jgi:hypothetical protein